jgi:ABC-2 type transport system permease protein
MRQIQALIWKDFRLWAQKPGSWIIIFVVPLLFIWIMQAVFGSTGTPVVTVYAVNEDESKESERVIQTLQEADNIRVDLLETRSEANRRVGSGERMAAVVVPEGYGAALTTSHGAHIDIIIDPARSEQANIVVGLVNSVLSPLIIDAEVNRGIETSINQIITPFDQANQANPQPENASEGDSTGQPAPQPTPTSRATAAQTDTLRKFFAAALKGVVSSQVQEALDNPQVQLTTEAIDQKGKARTPSLLDYLVPGYSLMFVFFLVPNLATTVIEERQSGTLRRLLSAPLPRSRILVGKMLPYFLIAVVQMMVVFLASWLLFGIDLGGSLLGLGIIILSSSLAMACLGILISAVAQTEGQANGLAMILVLAMAVISGSMFPSISIPGLQMATPHYWAMQGFLNIISRGQGVQGAMLPTGILLTMSAFFFMVGAIRFRFE